MIPSARQNTAMQHIYGMGGRALWQKSCDAGERWMLGDVGGALLRAWDERLHTKRATYDAMRRATHQYVQQGAGAEQLVGRTVYGEAHPNAAALNLRGKAYQGTAFHGRWRVNRGRMGRGFVVGFYCWQMRELCPDD